jgi:hypothetical protein
MPLNLKATDITKVTGTGPTHWTSAQDQNVEPTPKHGHKATTKALYFTGIQSTHRTRKGKKT